MEHVEANYNGRSYAGNVARPQDVYPPGEYFDRTGQEEGASFCALTYEDASYVIQNQMPYLSSFLITQKP